MFGWKSSPCSSSAYSLSSLTLRNHNFFVPPPEISSPELTRSSKQCEEEGDIEFNEKLTHLKSHITPPRFEFNTDFERADLADDENQKHVEYEHDVAIHAGQFSAQSKTDVVTGNDQKFTTSELKTEGEKEMLKGNQYKKTPARTTSKKNQRSSMFFLVSLVVLFFMLPHSGAVVVTFPSQPMPDACKAYFDEALTCPKPGIDNYENISQTCCTDTETKLHCLSSSNEVKICCLVPINVEKGMVIKITDHGGSPQMTKHPCEKDRYKPDDRQSNQIFHPYCTSTKSVCNPSKGQQLRCNGGTTDNDLCQCRNGNEPRPFDPDGYCREAPCTNGTQRNVSYDSDPPPCTPDMKPLNYTCQKAEPQVINDKDNRANLAYLGLLALVLIPVGVAVFIGLYKTNRNFRNWVQRRRNPQAESNGPPNGIPLMDLTNQGQQQNGTPSQG